MADETQRLGLESDFLRKRTSYFDANYGAPTLQNSLRRERRDQINQWIEETSDLRRVLDIGCGPALLYPDAYKRCDTYYAMDLVATNLEEVRNNYERARTIHADLDSLDWKHAPPTLIICSGCIEYSTRGISNLHRMCQMLQAGGTLVVSFPNAFSPHRLWFENGYRQIIQMIDRRGRRPTYARRLFRYGSVTRALANEHMEVISRRRLGFCFVPPPFDSWMPCFSFHARTLLEQWVPVLGPFSFEFLIVARK